MTHLELFSGIGGFRRALDLLTLDGVMPFKCVGYSEIDAKAKLTYQTNYDVEGETDMGDIVAFTANPANIEALAHFDLLTGGFPAKHSALWGIKLDSMNTEVRCSFELWILFKQDIQDMCCWRMSRICIVMIMAILMLE